MSRTYTDVIDQLIRKVNYLTTAVNNLNNGSGTGDGTDYSALTDQIEEITSQIDAINTAISSKADKATTLTGYGIIDAYTIDEVNAKIAEALSGIETGDGEGGSSSDYDALTVTVTALEEAVSELQESLSSKADSDHTHSVVSITSENGYDDLDSELDEMWSLLKTQEAITVNGVTGLGIDNGATIAAGTSLDDFVKMIVQKAVAATYTKPSVTIANNGGQASGNVEAGTTITPKLKATFNKNDAGDLESIVIKRGGSEVANDTKSPLIYTGDAVVIGDESITFSASATHGDAPVKNNNLGQESKENWFAGGTVNSGNYTITGKRNLFYGTGVGDLPEITSDMVRALANKKLAPAAGTSFNISVAVGQQYIVIAYPATLRDINNVTYVEANDSGMASSFTKTTINVADARGGENGLMSYKVYTYAMAVPAAAGMTFKVTI